jgi:hypothetical protein
MSTKYKYLTIFDRLGTAEEKSGPDRQEGDKMIAGTRPW